MISNISKSNPTVDAVLFFGSNWRHSFSAEPQESRSCSITVREITRHGVLETGGHVPTQNKRSVEVAALQCCEFRKTSLAITSYSALETCCDLERRLTWKIKEGRVLSSAFSLLGT